MRKESLNFIYEHAKINANVVFIGSDLGHGILQDFKTEMPNQFFMEGISESHIVSMAAGMALTGSKVYIHTIAPFFVRRAFEHIALDVGFENLDVTLLCSGGGLVYGPLGHTHTMVDDFSILSSVPNLKIYAPADAPEAIASLQRTYDDTGPAYIRLGKGNEPSITKQYLKKDKSYLQINKNENSFLIITTGIMLHSAIEITNQLQNIDIIHYSMITPFNLDNELVKVLNSKTHVFILEEHLNFGGLKSRVNEVIINHHLSEIQVFSFNLGNQYIDKYGRQEDLFKDLSLDTESLIKNFKKILSPKSSHEF